MRFVLDPLLSSTEVAELRQQLLGPNAVWVDGAATAGWHARERKHNRQLQSGSGLHALLSQQLHSKLLGHPLLQAAGLPRQIHGILFSRSGVGEGYARHVDNAWMAGGRSDLSISVFLSNPDGYDGGALVLESPSGEETFRLQEGQALVYPSTLLHRVEPVSAGERLVAVAWLQSRIRHDDQRELLFELDTARRALFARSGQDEVFDLVSRSYANLLRRWDS